MYEGQMWVGKDTSDWDRKVKIKEVSANGKFFSGYWFTNDPSKKHLSGDFFGCLDISWLKQYYIPLSIRPLSHYLETGS
jgi:hypothetical protein